MSPSPVTLPNLIEQARRLVRRDITLAVVGAALLVVPIVLLSALGLAADTSWAAPSPAPLLLELAAVLTVVVVFLVVRRRWLAGTAERDLTAIAESGAGLPPGSVLGVLELGRGMPPGTSIALFQREAASVSGRFGAATSRDVSGGLGRRARMRRGVVLGALGVLTLFTGILGFVSPDRVHTGWSPLLHPVAHLSSPPLPGLVVRPGDTEVLRGSDLAVRIRAEGRFAVTLVWRAEGDVPRRETVAVAADTALGVLPAVDASTQYWVEAPDGARSATFVVTPRDPLLVTDLTVVVRYPAYVGRSTDRYTTEVPPLELPEGSTLLIEGRTTRPIVEAGLAGTSGMAARLDVEDDRFSGSWTPAAGGVYEWKVRGADGSDPVTSPAPLEITVLPDEPPVVEVTYPGRDTIIDPMRLHTIAADARDDYGVATATLVSWRVSAGRTEPPTEMPIPVDSGGGDRVLVRGVLDLRDRDLLPGDTIKYFVRVADNSPRRQAAVSTTFALYLPGTSDLRDRATEDAREMVERVEELTQATRDLQDATRTLERRTEANRNRQNETNRNSGRGSNSESGNLGFRESEQARQILEQQQQVMQELADLRDKLQAMQEQMENAGLRDPETQQRLQELREMYDQLMSPEVKQQMEALQEALAKLDPEQLEKALEQLAQQQSDMREKLEESLEELKRAEVEQRTNALAQETRELATQQQALAEAMRSRQPTQQDTETQRRLEQRAGDLSKAVDQLGKDLEQQKSADAGQEAARAANDIREAQREMNQAAQQAGQRQGQDAAKAGDQAASQLEEAAKRLESVRNSMSNEAERAMQEALQQATNEALSLAQRQQSMRERMEQSQQGQRQGEQGQQQQGQQQGQRQGQQQGQRGQQQGQQQGGQGQQQGGQGGQQMSQEEMQRLREEQAALQQGLSQLGRNLQQAAEQSGMMNRDVSAALGRANMSMGQTMQSLEQAQQGQQLPTEQAGQTVEALNRLALSLLNQQQGQGQQQGGTEQAMQELSELAQQQGQLNGRSNALAPMNLPSQTMAQQLNRLAQEQRQIASQIEGVNQQVGREDVLGQLEEMAREAERLARELEGGRIPSDVLARQERLFHRLLDAGRSLERDETSPERVAERPGDYERSIAPALEAALIESTVRYRVPTPEELKNLSPAYRRMILEYFERINKPPTTERRQRE